MKTVAVSALLWGALIGLANADGTVSTTPELTLAMSASDTLTWPHAPVSKNTARAPRTREIDMEEMDVMQKLTLEQVSNRLGNQLEQQLEQQLQRVAQ